jgi:hypothetical protein
VDEKNSPKWRAKEFFEGIPTNCNPLNQTTKVGIFPKALKSTNSFESKKPIGFSRLSFTIKHKFSMYTG